MSDASHAVTVGLLRRMLREAFQGPPGPWTYFSDAGPGHGLLGTIGRVSSADASQQGGPGRTTIAGHVHHVRASLALATRELRGEEASRDRSQSWSVSAVNDAEWDALRAEVGVEYERMAMAVETRAVWDENALGTAIGAVAHTAYHLGAIRQRLARADAARS
jgi:hypothetical protein